MDIDEVIDEYVFPVVKKWDRIYSVLEEGQQQTIYGELLDDMRILQKVARDLWNHALLQCKAQLENVPSSGKITILKEFLKTQVELELNQQVLFIHKAFLSRFADVFEDTRPDGWYIHPIVSGSPTVNYNIMKVNYEIASHILDNKLRAEDRLELDGDDDDGSSATHEDPDP